MDKQDDLKEIVTRYKQRLGLLMFGIYVLAYSGFVFTAVLNVQLMDIVLLAGLNLAVFYGIGLIVFAIVLALVYSLLCNRRERALASGNINPNQAPGKGGGT
jgi:uncharacterized membrane protein (DUF485 family)